MATPEGDDSSLSEVTRDRVEEARQSIDPPVENEVLPPPAPMQSEQRVPVEFHIPTHIHREDDSVSDIMTLDGVSVQLRNEVVNQAEVEEEHKRVMSEFGLNDVDPQRPPVVASVPDQDGANPSAQNDALQPSEPQRDLEANNLIVMPDTNQNEPVGEVDEEAGNVEKPLNNKGFPSTIVITGATLSTEEDSNEERASFFHDGMIFGISIVRLIGFLAFIMLIAIIAAVSASVVSAKNSANSTGGAASAQDNSGPNGSAPITVPPIYYAPKSPTPAPSVSPSQPATLGKTNSPTRPISNSPTTVDSSSAPTQEETKSPTDPPTPEPTKEPTPEPTKEPTPEPTKKPMKPPTTPSPTSMPIPATSNPTNPRFTSAPTPGIGKNPENPPPSFAPTLLVTTAPTSSATTPPTPTPSAYDTPEPKTPSPTSLPLDSGLRGQILSFSPNSADAFLDESSPQSQALNWLEGEDYSSVEAWSIMQKWALAVFAFSTGVDRWLHGTYSWVTEWDECSWYGVSCDWSGQVDSITLDQNGLEGTIPDEFTLLKDTLVTLDLRDNDISGSFPASFGELTALKVLHLEWNKLKGSLPTEIGEMQALEDLYVEWNSLDGQIPDEFGNLNELKVISIYSNYFTGSLPNSVCDINYDELLIDCREVSTKCYTTCYWQCDGDSNTPC